MTQKKNIRLITNGNYPCGKEWVEIDPLGILYWKAEEADVACSIIVDVEFVETIFERVGRVFDRARLPANVVTHPYAVNL